ncbi:MAG: MBL fold metallo-hydrolase [Myxococcales bacterium]|nr:MBL fold metallo-hydrolase [Myxococcales bacterium]
MKIDARFHDATSTLTYVVHDEATRDAVVIDPVLDYDPIASQTSTSSAQALLAWIRERGLKVHFILETHAHADHLTAAQFLAHELGAKVVIGEDIRVVQKTFVPVFGLGPDFRTDGSQFDKLVADGEVVRAGSLEFRAMHTPGHTPACMSYVVGDAVFTGDALFMPDSGTGRCDFPRGSAEQLYASIQRLYALPDATRVFVGHDYQPNGRPLAYETTIGASKRDNNQLTAETTQAAFVRLRNERDATLAAPRLLFPSVQVNIQAGHLPQPNAAGIRNLSLPLNLFAPTDDAGTVLPAAARARAS